MGFRDESGEIFVGTDKGVIKARTVRRKGSVEQRWNGEILGQMVGTPWEPEPGRVVDYIRANVLMPRAFEAIPELIRERKGTPIRYTRRPRIC